MLAVSRGGVQLSFVRLMEEPEKISQESRRAFLVAAWLIAGIATVVANLLVAPLAILFVWMFPYGLFRLIFRPDQMNHGQLDFVAIFGGWFLFGIISVFTYLQSRKVRFLAAYALLCVLLALNVVGCNKMMHDPMQDSL